MVGVPLSVCTSTSKGNPFLFPFLSLSVFVLPAKFDTIKKWQSKPTQQLAEVWLTLSRLSWVIARFSWQRARVVMLSFGQTNMCNIERKWKGERIEWGMTANRERERQRYTPTMPWSGSAKHDSRAGDSPEHYDVRHTSNTQLAQLTCNSLSFSLFISLPSLPLWCWVCCLHQNLRMEANELVVSVIWSIN